MFTVGAVLTLGAESGQHNAFLSSKRLVQF